MQYIFPNRYAQHWRMLSETINNNYFVDGDVLIIMGVYIQSDFTVKQYREQYPNSKIILYQLEPISENNVWYKNEEITKYLHEVDEVWDYDLNNIKYLREACGIHAYFRPFVFSETCCKYVDHNKQKDIDVLFYGYYTEHRCKFINKLSEGGKSIVWITHILHPTLDEYISRAKVVINIHHAENLQQQEQTRLFYLLSNGKNVISEKSRYNIYGDLVHEAETPEEMSKIIDRLIDNYDPLIEYHRKYLFKNLKYDDIFKKFVESEINNEI